MISIDEFDQLAPGDVLELGSAFVPLTSEPVLLRVDRRAADVVHFDVSLFGVNLGPARCEKNSEGVLAWVV